MPRKLIVSILMAILLLTSFASLGASKAKLGYGLVGWWLFDEGSGTAGFLAAALGVEQDGATSSHPNGRSAEEACYREILADQYESPQPILDLVAHWNPQLQA